jgi:hypothetical protein
VISMAQGAKTWLEQTQQAHVLYAFESVLNLVNQEGDVLALVSNAVGNGPFALLAEPGPFPEASIDSSLLIFENGMWLGDWLIDAEEAQLWDAHPNWESVRLQRVNLGWAAAQIASLLTQHAEPDSLARLILDPMGTSPLPARVFQAAEQNIPLLFKGISERNLDQIQQAAKKLAGLGPGLTPAGDDLLVGAMHGLFATLSEEEAIRLSAVIRGAAVPRTTALSAAWLLAAARGESGEPWHQLINAIASQDEPALHSAVMRILPTGHTSGADALGGFLGLLQGIAK